MANKQFEYVIELLAGDEKFRKQIVDIIKSTDKNGEQIANNLTEGAKKGADGVKNALSGINLEELFGGKKAFHAFQAAIGRFATANAGSLKGLAESGENGLNIIKEIVTEISGLGKELKSVDSGFNVSGMVRNLKPFILELAKATKGVDGLAGQPQKVAEAFEGMFKGVKSSDITSKEIASVAGQVELLTTKTEKLKKTLNDFLKDTGKINVNLVLKDDAEKKLRDSVNNCIRDINANKNGQLDEIKIKLSSKSEEIDIKDAVSPLVDGQDGYKEVKQKTEARFAGIGKAIDDKQNKILGKTKQWHKDMVDALSFDKKELDVNLKLSKINKITGEALFDSIQRYFNEDANAIEIKIHAEDIAKKVKDALGEGGFFIGGGPGGGSGGFGGSPVTLDPDSFASALEGALEKTISKLLLGKTEDKPSVTEQVPSQQKNATSSSSRYYVELQETSIGMQELIDKIKELSKMNFGTKVASYFKKKSYDDKGKDNGLDLEYIKQHINDDNIDSIIVEMINRTLMQMDERSMPIGSTISEELTQTLKGVNSKAAKYIQNVLLGYINKMYQANNIPVESGAAIKKELDALSVVTGGNKQTVERVGWAYAGYNGIYTNSAIRNGKMVRTPSIEDFQDAITSWQDVGEDTTQLEEIKSFREKIGDSQEVELWQQLEEKVEAWRKSRQGKLRDLIELFGSFQGTLRFDDGTTFDVKNIKDFKNKAFKNGDGTYKKIVGAIVRQAANDTAFGFKNVEYDDSYVVDKSKKKSSVKKVSAASKARVARRDELRDIRRSGRADYITVRTPEEDIANKRISVRKYHVREKLIADANNRDEKNQGNAKFNLGGYNKQKEQLKDIPFIKNINDAKKQYNIAFKAQADAQSEIDKLVTSGADKSGEEWKRANDILETANQNLEKAATYIKTITGGFYVRSDSTLSSDTTEKEAYDFLKSRSTRRASLISEKTEEIKTLEEQQKSFDEIDYNEAMQEASAFLKGLSDKKNVLLGEKDVIAKQITEYESMDRAQVENNAEQQLISFGQDIERIRKEIASRKSLPQTDAEKQYIANLDALLDDLYKKYDFQENALKDLRSATDEEMTERLQRFKKEHIDVLSSKMQAKDDEISQVEQEIVKANSVVDDVKARDLRPRIKEANQERAELQRQQNADTAYIAQYEKVLEAKKVIDEYNVAIEKQESAQRDFAKETDINSESYKAAKIALDIATQGVDSLVSKLQELGVLTKPTVKSVDKATTVETIIGNEKQSLIADQSDLDKRRQANEDAIKSSQEDMELEEEIKQTQAEADRVDKLLQKREDLYRKLEDYYFRVRSAGRKFTKMQEALGSDSSIKLIDGLNLNLSDKDSRGVLYTEEEKQKNKEDAMRRIFSAHIEDADSDEARTYSQQIIDYINQRENKVAELNKIEPVLKTIDKLVSSMGMDAAKAEIAKRAKDTNLSESTRQIFEQFIIDPAKLRERLIKNISDIQNEINNYNSKITNFLSSNALNIDNAKKVTSEKVLSNAEKYQKEYVGYIQQARDLYTQLNDPQRSQTEKNDIELQLRNILQLIIDVENEYSLFVKEFKNRPDFKEFQSLFPERLSTSESRATVSEIKDTQSTIHPNQKISASSRNEAKERVATLEGRSKRALKSNERAQEEKESIDNEQKILDLRQSQIAAEERILQLKSEGKEITEELLKSEANGDQEQFKRLEIANKRIALLAEQDRLIAEDESKRQEEDKKIQALKDAQGYKTQKTIIDRQLSIFNAKKNEIHQKQTELDEYGLAKGYGEIERGKFKYKTTVDFRQSPEYKQIQSIETSRLQKELQTKEEAIMAPLREKMLQERIKIYRNAIEETLLKDGSGDIDVAEFSKKVIADVQGRVAKKVTWRQLSEAKDLYIGQNDDGIFKSKLEQYSYNHNLDYRDPKQKKLAERQFLEEYMRGDEYIQQFGTASARRNALMDEEYNSAIAKELKKAGIKWNDAIHAMAYAPDAADQSEIEQLEAQFQAVKSELYKALSEKMSSIVQQFSDGIEADKLQPGKMLVPTYRFSGIDKDKIAQLQAEQEAKEAQLPNLDKITNEHNYSEMIRILRESGDVKALQTIGAYDFAVQEKDIGKQNELLHNIEEGFSRYTSSIRLKIEEITAQIIEETLKGDYTYMSMPAGSASAIDLKQILQDALIRQLAILNDGSDDPASKAQAEYNKGLAQASEDAGQGIQDALAYGGLKRGDIDNAELIEEQIRYQGEIRKLERERNQNELDLVQLSKDEIDILETEEQAATARKKISTLTKKLKQGNIDEDEKAQLGRLSAGLKSYRNNHEINPEIEQYQDYIDINQEIIDARREDKDAQKTPEARLSRDEKSFKHIQEAIERKDRYIATLEARLQDAEISDIDKKYFNDQLAAAKESKNNLSAKLAKVQSRMTTYKGQIEGGEDDSNPNQSSKFTDDSILGMFRNAIREGLAGVTAGGTVNLDASLYDIATETTLRAIFDVLTGGGKAGSALDNRKSKLSYQIPNPSIERKDNKEVSSKSSSVNKDENKPKIKLDLPSYDIKNVDDFKTKAKELYGKITSAEDGSEELRKAQEELLGLLQSWSKNTASGLKAGQTTKQWETYLKAQGIITTEKVDNKVLLTQSAYKKAWKDTLETEIPADQKKDTTVKSEKVKTSTSKYPDNFDFIAELNKQAAVASKYQSGTKEYIAEQAKLYKLLWDYRNNDAVLKAIKTKDFYERPEVKKLGLDSELSSSKSRKAALDKINVSDNVEKIAREFVNGFKVAVEAERVVAEAPKEIPKENPKTPDIKVSNRKTYDSRYNSGPVLSPEDMTDIRMYNELATSANQRSIIELLQKGVAVNGKTGEADVTKKNKEKAPSKEKQYEQKIAMAKSKVDITGVQFGAGTTADKALADYNAAIKKVDEAQKALTSTTVKPGQHKTALYEQVDAELKILEKASAKLQEMINWRNRFIGESDEEYNTQRFSKGQINSRESLEALARKDLTGDKFGNKDNVAIYGWGSKDGGLTNSVYADVVENGMIIRYTYQVDKATGQVRRFKEMEQGLHNAFIDVNKAMQKQKEIEADIGPTFNEKAKEYQTYLGIMKKMQDLSEKILKNNVVSQDENGNFQIVGGDSEKQLQELANLAQRSMHLGGKLGNSALGFQSLVDNADYSAKLPLDSSKSVRDQLEKYVQDNLKGMNDYTFKSFKDNELTYQLKDFEEQVTQCKLKYSELHQAVVLSSQKMVGPIDGVIKKLESFDEKIERASSLGYLGDKDSAQWTEAQQGITDAVEKVKSALDGDYENEADKLKAVTAAQEELTAARNHALNVGDKLNKQASKNKNLAGGAAIRVAENQANRIASFGNQDGISPLGFSIENGQWAGDVPEFAQRYVEAYNRMIQKNEELKDKISDPNVQNQLKQLGITAQREGAKVVQALNYSQTLADKAIEWSNKTFYNSKQKKEMPLGASGGLGNTEELTPEQLRNLSATMKEYARETLGAELEHTKFKATNNELTGSIRVSKDAVAEMAVSYDKVTNKLYLYQKQEKESLTGFAGFWNGLKGKMRGIAQYLTMMTSVYRVMSMLRQGVTYVKEIDVALTELKKVTDETEETYDKFLETASKTARKVGSTIKDVVSSTADFARLGYSLKDATELATSAQVLLNTSEFTDVSRATDSLISSIKAFDYTAKQSMHVVDILNEIGNNYAISTADLAQSLTKSSASLVAAGGDLAEAAALTATAM